MCPDNKRIREGTLSKGTAGYTAGRNRLTKEVVEWFARAVSDSIIATAPLPTISPPHPNNRLPRELPNRSTLHAEQSKRFVQWTATPSASNH